MERPAAAPGEIVITPGDVPLTLWRRILREAPQVGLAAGAREQVAACHAAVTDLIATGRPIYAVNTGFGKLAAVSIDRADLAELQRNLILSHCAGTGELLSDDLVRLIMVMKAAALAQGFSGVRWEIVEALLRLANAGVYPCIPAKGSVGASGDLAPLAHMAAVLIGLGEVRIGGRIVPAVEGLAKAGLKPLTFAPKEGVALINGTQVSAALALAGLFAAEDVLQAALVTGALVGRSCPRQRNAFRCPHPGRAPSSRPAGCRRRLPHAIGRQSDPRRQPCEVESAGPLLSALPAAGDGRLSRQSAFYRRDVADGGQRRHRQSARFPAG